MFKSVEVEEIFSELAWGPYINDKGRPHRGGKEGLAKADVGGRGV